ncbi:MAG TPA: sigma-70 family RNA polymerase sigma factor [Labilithrix sp.]
MSRAPSAFDPDLRSALVAMVRKRVPEAEVEDIVQSALAEAIESPHAPDESEALRRWIFGVAKNKVVDYHRRAGREVIDVPEVAGAPAPHDEADLLRWAERHLPAGDDNKKTLDWMLREGEGEKLESIAESEKLPAPRVRQRVSRLRRHFKANWQREVAILAALGVIITAALLFFGQRKDPNEPIAKEPVDPRAAPMRLQALERCNAADWKPCIDGLDEAKKLDPAGDDRPEVKDARAAAAKALAPAPTPSASSSAILNLPPDAVKKSDSDFFSTPPPSGKPQPRVVPTNLPTKANPKTTTAKPSGTDDFSQVLTPSPLSSGFPSTPSPQKGGDFGGSKKKTGPSKPGGFGSGGGSL